MDEEDMFLTLDAINVQKEDEVIVKQDDIIEEKKEFIDNTDDEKNKPEFANSQFEKKNEEDPLVPESKDSSSTISVLANYLKEEGVLSSELEGFDKIESLEDLKQLVAKQIESERFSDLSESQKRYLNAIESGAPVNEYEAMEKDIRALENISIDDLESDQQLRFDIITNDLINSGLSEEKAVAMANRSFELGKDQDDAKESIQSLYKKSVENFNAKMTEKKEVTRVSLEDTKKLVESKDFVMGDMKLSKENKAEIFKMMTTQVDTTPEGIPVNQFNKWRQENGVEAEIILNALFINTNGFKNLGDIKAQVGSKTAQELEKRLRSIEAEEIRNTIQGTNRNASGLTLQ
jgi:hypothetical protein